MKAYLRRFFPLGVALCLYLLLFALVFRQMVLLTSGHIGYALDDAYIHLAIVKNVTQHGIWGVTPYEFSGASSSPLWILLISLLSYLPLPLEYLPLLLNVFLSCLLLVVTHGLLMKHFEKGWLRTAILCFAVVCTPLVPLSFTGMEHILHCILCVLWIHILASVCAQHRSVDIPFSSKNSLLLCVLAFLSTATRVESLFLAVLAALLLWIQRRKVQATATMVGTLLPLVFYAGYSVTHGSLWLPNSVLLKASVQDSTLHSLAHALNYGMKQLLEYPEVHLLGITFFAVLFWGGVIQQQRGYTFFALLSCTWMLLAQVFTAKIGWFFRYEAYLILSGILYLAIALQELRLSTVLSTPLLHIHKKLQYVAFGVAIIFAALPFIHRVSKAHKQTAIAITNIYEQQYQIGRFLQEYYKKETVVLTDIGAPSFLSAVHSVDMLGLGDITVARARRAKIFTTEFAENYARQRKARIAITFRSWWQGSPDNVAVSPGQVHGIPPSWKECGTWRISNNVICGDDNVQFYALDSTEVQPLQEALYNFASQLPPGVQQSGSYCR